MIGKDRAAVSDPQLAPAEDYVLGPSPADWERLERPLALDPVTFEILRHKLEAINEEQAIALKEVAVSPIVTDASDFNNALYTADGRIASMGPQVVFHSGSMPIVLRYVRELFEDDIHDGDMFVVNDPYYGAVHHPDISLVAPIFHGDRLLAWAGVAAHQVDHDGIANRLYRIDVRLVKSDDTLLCDLSESAAQSPTYLNSAEGALVGAVFGGVAPVLGGGIPWNQGILGAIELIAPPGTIVNA